MSKKKQKSTKTLPQQITDYFLSITCGLYVFVILVIYPLYYDNKYFNMGEAKFKFFAIVTITALAILVLTFVAWTFAYSQEVHYSTIFGNYSIVDWFVVAFFIISFCSFLFSDYSKSTALVGYGGWNMGFLSQLGFVLIYFFVSRFWQWSPITLETATLTGAITYFLAILQRFMIDPLHMYDGLQAADIEKFLSTLGQTSWFSSYVVLIFPLCVYYFWSDTKIFSRIIYGFFTAFGFATLCTMNADSAYVAFGLILLTFLWFSFESNEKIFRWLEVIMVGLLTFRIIGFLQDRFPERMITLVTGDEALTSFVNHSPIILFLLIGVVILYIVLRVLVSCESKNSKKKIDFSQWKWFRKVIVIGFILCVWAAVMLIVLTTNQKLPPFLNKLYNVDFLHYTDSWGNHRGFNWRMAWTAFSHSSVKDTFIGVGPDCFAESMSKYCCEEVKAYWNGKTLACAHNEWLNMLVTEGFFGLLSYIGIFITCILRAGKVAYKEPAVIPFIAAVLAYMGHNFFCYQTCVCTPIIFIFMGIAELICRKVKKEEKEGA